MASANRTTTNPRSAFPILRMRLLAGLMLTLADGFGSASFFFLSVNMLCVSFLPPGHRKRVVGEVASPGLEGGQVAVLHLHAAVSCHATVAAYSSIRLSASAKSLIFSCCMALTTVALGAYVACNFGELR